MLGQNLGQKIVSKKVLKKLLKYGKKHFNKGDLKFKKEYLIEFEKRFKSKTDESLWNRIDLQGLIEKDHEYYKEEIRKLENNG